MKTGKILVLNGPNLNMVGIREPAVYGNKNLESINSTVYSYAAGMKINCDFFQTNSEGELIDKIHSVYKEYDGCIINAGALTHYSFAVRDAIAAVDKPFIEVHLSNVDAREDFRKISVIAPVCVGSISGFGVNSYLLAVNAMRDLI